jgi:hypothetical protein
MKPINKYVLIGFVALAVLVVCLLRPRREHMDMNHVDQINDRLSKLEAKIEESESKRGKSTGEVINALGSS